MNKFDGVSTAGGPVFRDGPLATTTEFGSFLAAETDKWGKVIRAANIKVE
jgi:hypothetical protein